MTMTRYVEQLHEDIRGAEEFAEKRVSEMFTTTQEEEYHISFDDDNSAGIIISELFELDQISFPERKHLNEEQISILVEAIESLWKAYGLNPLFEEGLPDESKYCQLRNYLNQKVYPVYGKMVDVELCDYNQHDCPFINWCTIATTQKEKDNKKNISA